MKSMKVGSVTDGSGPSVSVVLKTQHYVEDYFVFFADEWP